MFVCLSSIRSSTIDSIVMKLLWIILYTSTKILGTKKIFLNVCLLCVPKPFKLGMHPSEVRICR